MIDRGRIVLLGVDRWVVVEVIKRTAWLVREDFRELCLVEFGTFVSTGTSKDASDLSKYDHAYLQLKPKWAQQTHRGPKTEHT